MSQRLLPEQLKWRFTLLYLLNTRVYKVFLISWIETKMVYRCLKSQKIKQCLKSNTLHFSNHSMSPVEHVMFTTWQLDSFQTINQWYPNLSEQGWKTLTDTQRKAFTFPPPICENRNYTGAGSSFLYPMSFREVLIIIVERILFQLCE